MKKRLFIVLSALLALTACFTSCQDTPAPVDTSTTTSADATPAPETDPVPETNPESSPATDEPETEAPLPSGMVLTSETKIYCSTRRNRTLYKLSTSLATRISEKTGIRQALLAGGVASSTLFRDMVRERIAKRDRNLHVCFGKPEYSGDNAVGVALIGAKKLKCQEIQ